MLIAATVRTYAVAARRCTACERPSVVRRVLGDLKPNYVDPIEALGGPGGQVMISRATSALNVPTWGAGCKGHGPLPG